MTVRLLVAGLLAIWAAAAAAQDEGAAARAGRRPDGPWFGITLPPGPGADEVAAMPRTALGSHP